MADANGLLQRDGGRFVRVCLGGTFDPLHAGHEAMLRRAFAASDVFVGITSDQLAARPDRSVADFSARAEAIREFAKSVGFAGTLTIKPLLDRIGPAATENYDAIVVSPETVAGANSINQLRKESGLPPLAIWSVPHVLADDFLPISATALAAGLIDREGRRLQPVRVHVGTANPVKLEGCRSAFSGLLQAPVEVTGFAVPSGVPEQPIGEQTLDGARNRAMGLHGEGVADYMVGIEAGLMQDESGAWFDVQAIVIIDRNGEETVGYGPAFSYPEWVTKRALAGEMISDIIGPVAGDAAIGGTTGAIGFLTNGQLDRQELTRIGLVMAFTPRLRRHLYSSHQESPA